MYGLFYIFYLWVYLTWLIGLDARFLDFFDLLLILYNCLLHSLFGRILWGPLAGLYRDWVVGGVDVNSKLLRLRSVAHKLLAVDDLLWTIRFGGIDRTLVELTAYLGIFPYMLGTTMLLDPGDHLNY